MILVTGATGNVGAHVVRELRERGAHVRALVRDPARAAERLGTGVELAVGDFSDPASLRRALDGVDAVLLSCGNQPRQAELEGAAIDAAAAAGVRRLVKLSTVGAEPGSPAAFWDHHGRAERHLAGAGVPAVVLRANFHMSNLLAAADRARRDGRLFAPAGSARIGMVDPRDVAAAAAVALTADGHEGRTYELTGPEAMTYARVAEELSTTLGRPVEYVDVPDAVALDAMVGNGIPPWFAEQLVRVFGQLRAGAADRVTDAVRALTGREPRTLARFLRDHVATALAA
jgi:uncharacterized protein YbjT (DUF2867 family)